MTSAQPNSKRSYLPLQGFYEDDFGKFDEPNLTNSGWRKRREEFGSKDLTTGVFTYHSQGGCFLSRLAIGENIDRSVPG